MVTSRRCGTRSTSTPAGESALRWLPGRLLGRAVALLLAAHLSQAQVVRGTVVTSDEGARTSGVVLLLLDSANSERARALSREGGAFRVSAPGPGRYRLRAMRIGYAPTVTPLFDLRGDTAIAVRISESTVVLPSVTTRERSRCSVRPDTSLATWGLWEQARTALLAAAISMTDRENSFSVVLSSRLYALRPQELSSVNFAEVELQGAQPWKSFPADSLALNGYVFASDSGLTFVAPDIDVLLSSSFHATHCLRLDPDAKRGSGQVGIRFAPASGTRHVDIRGTFWLDAESRELRSLDFTYVNLSLSGSDSVATGNVEFLRLATDEWIIPRWVIRAPVPTTDDMRAIRETDSTALMNAPPWRAVGFRVKRGEVLSVRAGGDSLLPPVWKARTAALRVKVTGRQEGRPDVPVAGAVVRLPGSTRQGVTDSAGFVAIDRLTEGEYELEVTTSAYDALQRAPEHETVVLRPGATLVTGVRVASPDQAMRELCPASRFFGLERHDVESTGILTGMVTRGDVPEAGAAIVVQYAGEPNPPHKRAALSRSAARTLSNGRFAFCYAPRNEPLRVQVRTVDGLEAIVLTRLARDQAFAAVDVVVGPGGRP